MKNQSMMIKRAVTKFIKFRNAFFLEFTIKKANAPGIEPSAFGDILELTRKEVYHMNHFRHTSRLF